MTKQEAVELLEQWADQKEEVQKIRAKMEAAITPIRNELESKIAEVSGKFEFRIADAEKRAVELEHSLLEFLSRKKPPFQIESDRAIAAIIEKIGRRVIDVRQFIQIASDRGDAMYDALTVGVAKAERLLGAETIDRISTKSTHVEKIVKFRNR